MPRNRRGILKKDIESPIGRIWVKRSEARYETEEESWKRILKVIGRLRQPNYNYKETEEESWKRILKADIKNRQTYGIYGETEEESWKRILKDDALTTLIVVRAGKQKRNPEKGYWKLTACRKETLLLWRNRRGILKKDIESFVNHPTPWTSLRCGNRRGILKKDIERHNLLLPRMLLFWLETEEESWKRILKA